MSNRVSPTFIVPAIFGAALAGYLLTNHTSATAASALPPAAPAAATAPTPAADPGAPSLPPNHPAVPGMPGHKHGAGATPNGVNLPPSIQWSAPPSWQSLPNPNPMRIATYRAGEGTEASIARAGGPLEANITRWSQQFAGAPQPSRHEKQVHGIHVTTIHLAGTYEASGMGVQAPETHDGWAMLAAIIEAPGSPYFIKVLGPAAQVDLTRRSFDALVDSITPVTTK